MTMFEILAICLYFLPTVWAIDKRATLTPIIFVVNLLTGWTVAGWFLALIGAWSATNNRHRSCT